MIQESLREILEDINAEHTQEEMAGFFGVSRKTVSCWISGQSPIKMTDDFARGLIHYGYGIYITKRR